MDINELFKKDKRESAVDIVVNNIKQLLIERKLKPGDRLPSELEISEGMGVSRGSVREAMKILTAFGLVDIRVEWYLYLRYPWHQADGFLTFQFLHCQSGYEESL